MVLSILLAIHVSFQSHDDDDDDDDDDEEEEEEEEEDDADGGGDDDDGGGGCYSAVLEGMLNFPFHFHEIVTKLCISAEINYSTDTPLTKMDPDTQFCSNFQYTHGDYMITT